MPKPYGEWRYVPGDFYRLDERTGFKVRNARQRKEWQGLIVARDVYETRHSQDFVKGVWDDQTVPEPRPRTPGDDIFIAVIGDVLLLTDGTPVLLVDGIDEIDLVST